MLGLFVAGTGGALGFVGHRLHRLQVGQHQFGIDRLSIAYGIDRAVDMGDVGVVEATHHVQNGIDCADI